MTILQHSIAQAAAATGYQIARSLRFNSADSANLTRTPSVAGNRQKWTWSGWVKKARNGTAMPFFGTRPATGASNTNTIQFGFDSSDKFGFGFETAYYLVSTQVFRDPSAFYHFNVVFDAANATAANRIRVWVNGVEITAFATDSRGTISAVDHGINIASQIHQIGSLTSNTWYGDFYLADIYFIDGQTLDPTSFGQTDSATGVWVPKAYTGTYGTNGFWLKLDDNSNTTAATLGKDSSGNGNNWTPNNFSVTAGVGNDSLVDSPTNYGTDTGVGGEVRGNYATLNPLKNGGSALSNGNLDQVSSANNVMVLCTFGMQSGKWYWEVTGATAHGIAQDNVTLANYVGQNANSWGFHQTGQTYTNTVASSYGSTWTGTDVIGVALDADNGRVFFSKNGVWQNSGSPTAGTNPAYSSLTNGPYFAAIQANSGATAVCNFGQRPFAYTAPSGFKALCTTNLPTPAIGASASTLASKNFDILTYTGNGATRTFSGLGFQPDISWIKVRNVAYDHRLWDAVRGVGLKGLYTSLNSAEGSGDAFGYISAFTSDGFTVTSGSTSIVGVNENTSAYAAWNWKANGAGSSNTAGSITSTVSVNTAAGISIVTWTGNATNATIGHGLGAVPKMMLIKWRSGGGLSTDNWTVYHEALGNTKALRLNTTDAAVTSSTFFNNTSPTSTVFTMSSGNGANLSGSLAVAYCFAEVAGFSRFGSYTGNGNADGPFVYCGFRPRWIMIKRTDVAGEGWPIQDTTRFPTNVVTDILAASSSASEATLTSIYNVDILSNGFKIRNTNAPQNANGSIYIFAAFAEAPFNYARAR